MTAQNRQQTKLVTNAATPGATTAPVSRLRPAPYNPRTISKGRLAALGKAMREYGPLRRFAAGR